MYKEMIENLQAYFAGTLDEFDDYAIVEIGLRNALSTVGPTNNAASSRKITLHNLKRITRAQAFQTNMFGGEIRLPALVSITGNQQFQQSAVTKVLMPNLESLSDFNWFFYGCSMLTEVDLGKVTSLPNAYYASLSGCTSLTDVHCRSLQSATLLGYTYMMTTATTGYYTPHQVVFHCADCDVAWDDGTSSWKAVQS